MRIEGSSNLTDDEKERMIREAKENEEADRKEKEKVDVMFNSALLFELAVLKKHAEPILAEVPKFCDEYTETHRLIKFLNYFVSIPEREIPPTSLLREFVGGSSFRY
jgi:uridine kinase